MTLPSLPIHSLPGLTAAMMREVDRLMVEDYGIVLLQMMENAGRHLAHLARVLFFDGDPRDRRVVVLAGPGGNGGGGMVCARWLHNWGAEVSIWATAPVERFADVPRVQRLIAQRLDMPDATADGNGAVDLPPADLIVDALLGYSLRGAPSGGAAVLVRAANAADAPILSLDIPTGVDATTGAVHTPAISAAATMTLALPKTGLLAAEAAGHVGRLYLADIGVPPGLYAAPSLGLTVGPLFATADLIELVP